MFRFIGVLFFVALSLQGISQIIVDGILNEQSWGKPLATDSGGPAPGFGAGHEIRALYVTAITYSDIYIGVAGNVQPNNRILVFIDSKAGGFSRTDFGRGEAPQALDNLNPDIKFDAGFAPDYCLVIGKNINQYEYTFDLFVLTGKIGTTTGHVIPLGSTGYDPDVGASPLNNNYRRGFEVKITASLDGIASDIQFTNGSITMMAMYVSDDGAISNQFMTPASVSQGNIGTQTVDFGTLQAGFVSFSPSQVLPVKFTFMNSKIIEDEAFVVWSVAEDAEVNHYELEESSNGSVFKKLMNITSKRSTGQADYIVSDKKLNIGNNYYRLKAVGLTGNVSYSKILKIPYGRIDNRLFVYPNPAAEILNVQLHGLNRGNYKVHVYTSSGQEVFSKSIPHNGTDKTISIPLPPGLQRGIYRLLFINKYEFFKQNFTVR